MPLSKAQDIVERLGYSMEIFFTQDLCESSPKGLVNPSLLVPTGEGYRLSRVTFLAFTLKKMNITKVELAKRIGNSVQTVHSWFHKDDINIKKIYQIADALDLSIRINLNKKTNSKNLSPDRRYCIVSIVSDQVQQL